MIYQLGTKHTNVWFYGGNFHTDHISELRLWLLPIIHGLSALARNLTEKWMESHRGKPLESEIKCEFHELIKWIENIVYGIQVSNTQSGSEYFGCFFLMFACVCVCVCVYCMKNIAFYLTFIIASFSGSIYRKVNWMDGE